MRINTWWPLQDKAIAQAMESWPPSKDSHQITQAPPIVSQQRQVKDGQGALGESGLLKYIMVKEGDKRPDQRWHRVVVKRLIF